MKLVKGLKKVFRYNRLYGFSRTVIKVAGRTRNSKLNVFFPQKKAEKNVSLIGCGQFGFSTISYFLYKKRGSCFLECFDVDSSHSLSTAKFWGYKPMKNYHKLIENPKCKYVYIASDHYSHTKYAIEALKAGKIVYCEKPISVSDDQFRELTQTIDYCNGEIYFGYNRPFSKAIQDLVLYIKNNKKPLSLSCFISGHKLEANHWYNDPKEGTRICGNLGHWIDLSMYLFEQRGYLPREYKISINYADKAVRDDNISVSYSTDFGDIVTLVLTSRTEPFEGINETINLQCGNVISKIDDFQRQTIWVDEKKKEFRYKPKDVGHSISIGQPFVDMRRAIGTVLNSTTLMLVIMHMVVNGEKDKQMDLDNL